MHCKVVVVMDVFSIACNESTVMIDKGIVLLQNCMELQEAMQGSCIETCPTSLGAS
jgi:hypothetical protein